MERRASWRLPMAQIVHFACATPSYHPSLEKLLCQICCAEAERDCTGQDEAAPGDAESHHNDMLGDPELFEGHRAGQQLETPPGTIGDQACRRKTGINGCDQNSLRCKVGTDISG